MLCSLFDCTQKGDDITMKNIEVIISGGSGVIAKKLRENLHRLNIKSLVLSRKDIPIFKNELLLIYELGEPLSFDLYNFRYERVNFFHLAHDFDDKTRGKANINYRGSEIIISAVSKIQNINIIYFSTPIDKTYLKYSSIYQNQKFICEKLLTKYSAVILRPSLIISNISYNNSFFKKVSATSLPILIPVIKNKISPIQIDTFVEYLLNFLSDEKLQGKFIIKGDVLLSFKAYLKYYHNINAFEFPTFVFRLLIFLLKLTNIIYLWRLSEKILGIINVPCLEKIPTSKDNEWKVVTLFSNNQLKPK